MVGNGMSGYGNGMMGGSGGVLIGLIFFIIIIVFAYYVIKRLIEHDKLRNASEMSALDHAKARYAKGEITKDEFDEIKKNL
jgi:putative membrane protein